MGLIKRIKIAPGVHLNISKSGVSTSIGVPGATVNIGKAKTKATTRTPESGTKITSLDSHDAMQMQKRTKFPLKRLFGFSIIAFFTFLFFKMEQEREVKFSLVEANVLRVRAEPSINSNVIDRLEIGDKVKVKSSQNGWSFIEAKGTRGWVSSQYLSE